AERYQSAAEVADLLADRLGRLENSETRYAISLGGNRHTAVAGVSDPGYRAAKKKRRSWGGAGALASVALLGLPLGLYFYNQSKIDTLTRRINWIEKQGPFDPKLSPFAQEIRSKYVQLAVLGPACYQVGAPNEYLIETKNLNDRP